MYLWTPDAEEFYAELGWTVVERLEFLGEEVARMPKCLPIAPGPA